MIYGFTPFRTDKNLKQAYDDCMALLQPDDYGILRDHDTQFVDNVWMQRLEDGIEETKGVFFTGWTNKIHCPWQKSKRCPQTDDMTKHYEFGKVYQGEIMDRTNETDLLSGFFMVIKKSHWDKVKPFLTVQKCLGLDYEIHKVTKDLGEKIWQLPIYLYHWHRGGGRDKSHLL